MQKAQEAQFQKNVKEQKSPSVRTKRQQKNKKGKEKGKQKRNL